MPINVFRLYEKTNKNHPVNEPTPTHIHSRNRTDKSGP